MQRNRKAAAGSRTLAHGSEPAEVVVFFEIFCFVLVANPVRDDLPRWTNLLVEGLGVGGGASDVGVTGGLVGAGGELELVGGLEVGVAGGAVGGGVVLAVEEKGEHLSDAIVSGPAGL